MRFHWLMEAEQSGQIAPQRWRRSGNVIVWVRTQHVCLFTWGSIFFFLLAAALGPEKSFSRADRAALAFATFLLGPAPRNFCPSTSTCRGHTDTQISVMTQSAGESGWRGQLVWWCPAVLPAVYQSAERWSGQAWRGEQADWLTDPLTRPFLFVCGLASVFTYTQYMYVAPQSFYMCRCLHVSDTWDSHLHHKAFVMASSTFGNELIFEASSLLI